MNLIEVIRKYNKKWPGTIGSASSARVEIPRIPTGIFSLDCATGGGIPVGRVTLIYGRKASGKSSLAQRIISNAQQLCYKCYAKSCKCESRKMKVVHLDVEGTFDFDWAKDIGIDLEELIFARPEIAEQAIDMSIGLLDTGEVDLLVLDSIAAMEPAKEYVESSEKDMISPLARLVNKMVRKFVSVMNKQARVNKRVPTILLVNQVRQNISPFYAEKDALPGGMACGFVTSLEIRKSVVKYQVSDDEEDPHWVELKYEISKSKVSKPRVTGSYYLLLNDSLKKRGSIYEEDHILSMAVRCNLVKQSGHYYEFDLQKFPSRKDAITYLINNSEVLETLKSELLSRIVV